MLKNIPKMNYLALRSTHLEGILLSRDIHMFDERGSRETFLSVLDFSTDIRKCCTNNRSPNVLKNNNTLFVAEMWSRYLEKNETFVTLHWKRGSGLEMSITIDKKTEKTEVLFFHFLQWKYSHHKYVYDAISNFAAQLYAKNETFLTMTCFDMKASSYGINITAC